ncbi:MAG TPA: ABC transporter ATPase [Candidatus Accumulibacter phosphatis]|nr:ABC transporter ATPase [Candidatus Accumulibacter phosphatis]
MRKITEHVKNPENDLLVITADDPGHSKASRIYEIAGSETEGGPSKYAGLVIVFQDGPIGVDGINGVTHEVLLAIVADRIRTIQSGPYACRANACALDHIEEALQWLPQYQP